jgi:hypothetical protein
VEFESGFADTERAASVATKSVTTLVSALKQLQKAAADGELGAMRKAAERLAVVVKSVCQEVENAVTAWPFSMDSEERYMRESYVDELLERARAEGIQVQRLDDGYLVYPSVVRIIPSERTVTIDRAKVQAVRPSRLLKKLKAIQSAKPKMGPEQFLELLHRTYRILAEKQYGRTISLAAVYEALTLMPGSTATYGQTEFARDLFLLDRSGVTQTKSGAKISLPASTGTKGAKGTFSFVSLDGETVTYYGIHFLEASE